MTSPIYNIKVRARELTLRARHTAWQTLCTTLLLLLATSCVHEFPHPEDDDEDGAKPEATISVQLVFEFDPELPIYQKIIVTRADGTTETVTRAIDLSDYTVEFSYTGFMPSSYSIFTFKPVDAIGGVVFTSTPTEYDEDNAALGFDYVFVGDSETTVSVKLTVYDTDGEAISSTSAISIPLMRSQHTLIYGEFLTSSSNGGVGVDPDYDGQYNIEY